MGDFTQLLGPGGFADVSGFAEVSSFVEISGLGGTLSSMSVTTTLRCAAAAACTGAVRSGAQAATHRTWAGTATKPCAEEQNSKRICAALRGDMVRPLGILAPCWQLQRFRIRPGQTRAVSTQQLCMRG